MKSRPSPVLYHRFPAVIIPVKASPGVEPTPILALPLPLPPPWKLRVTIPTAELNWAVVKPGPLKSRKETPYPTKPPDVPIPICPAPTNWAAVTTPLTVAPLLKLGYPATVVTLAVVTLAVVIVATPTVAFVPLRSVNTVIPSNWGIVAIPVRIRFLPLISS